MRSAREDFETPNYALDLVAKLSAAQDQIRELTRQRDDARDLAVRSGIFESDHDPKVAALLALIESQPHQICDDGWYSCSQAIDPYDGEPACIDEHRRGDPCDCGRDALVAKAKTIIGGES